MKNELINIISKVLESDWNMQSFNKFLKKLTELTLEIKSNDKLMKILEELEKPIAVSLLFVKKWVPQLPPIKLNKVEKNYFI